MADALSGDLLLPGEWRLYPDVVQLIWQQFGNAEVDLFASELTTHCCRWFARTKTSNTLGQGALAHEWPNCLLYTVPPFSSRVAELSIVRVPSFSTSMGNPTSNIPVQTQGALVAPRWPGRPWFPLLLSLLQGKLWQLHIRRDLLSQLNGRVWHPDPARLQLWVWPVGPLLS